MAEILTGTLLEQGVVIGFIRGFVQGFAQGEIRGRQAAARQLLQLRFGTPSEDIIAQINAIQNLAQLEDLFDKIFEAETIDDIF